MKEIKTILAVLDRSSRDQRVISRAVALARCFDARLELFLCDAEHEYAFRHNYDDRGNAAGRSICVADAIDYLSSIGESLPLEASSVSVSASCESPLCEGILGKVRHLRPDLVLKSPDCDRPDCHLSFSDNDWQLASTCPAPLMFVGTREWSATPRIGAAVDASAQERPGLARAIVDVAEAMHAATHGRLEIVACVPESEGADSDACAQRLDDLVAPLPIGKECVHLLTGDPETVLPQFMDERGYDVLLMGALAHRAGFAPVVGSLTSRLIEALDCDFMLIKAETSNPREIGQPGSVSAAVNPAP